MKKRVLAMLLASAMVAGSLADVAAPATNQSKHRRRNRNSRRCQSGTGMGSLWDKLDSRHQKRNRPCKT